MEWIVQSNNLLIIDQYFHLLSCLPENKQPAPIGRFRYLLTKDIPFEWVVFLQ